MATLIKLVREKHVVEFDSGKFDNWCVFLTKENQYRYAPRDVEYYSFLQKLGDNHGHEKIYHDFVTFYERTDSCINTDVASLITSIADTYNTDAEETDVWFTVMYGNMIAEENKPRAMLKKKVKLLCMHQLLIERESPSDMINFFKGKSWRDLQCVMQQKGLFFLFFVIGYQDLKYFATL